MRRTSTPPSQRSAPAPDPSLPERGVTVRALTSQDDLAQGVAIQRLTWGQGFTEVVPATILQICQKVGGVAAGAFDAEGRMVGFVFGLTGVSGGVRSHWSHMLAVRPEARGLGLGKRLKLHQREVLLAADVVEVRWTFDPLVAQNANLNLNALGATIERYVPDMYGSDTGSELHSGLGTDRLVALWKIDTEAVRLAVAGRTPAARPELLRAPIANVRDDAAPSAASEPRTVPSDPAVRIEVPSDIQRVKADSMPAARQWRTSVREALMWYLGHGYQVAGFTQGDAGGRCFYLLERS